MTKYSKSEDIPVEQMMNNRESFLESIATNCFLELTKSNAGTISYKEKDYPIDFFQTVPRQDYKKTALITAGIHGYEPAGVFAIREFMTRFVASYSKDFNFMIFPCLNPTGFISYTRGNHEGIDINRSFNKSDKKSEEETIISNILKDEYFDVAINLHEDNIEDIDPEFNNPEDFYMYFICDCEDKQNGFNIIEKMISLNYPVTDMEMIYGDRCERGMIWNYRGENTSKNHITSLEAYLESRSKWIFTPETSTSWDISRRVKCLTQATRTILDEVISKNE